MAKLAISLGQYSDKGRKQANQDFHGALIPQEPLLSLKGIAVVLADGISTSEVGAVASESAVKSFLTGYGLAASRFTTFSYGEARPIDPAHNEDAWAKNRRDQFVITAGENAINPPGD